MLPELFVIALLTLGNVYGYFNVFMSPEEVMRLLGINSELYYVNQGVVNTYALNFVVMIPSNISDLQFTWQSLTNHTLLYALSIHYDKDSALLPPQMNISSTGVIPTSVQTFRVRLLCTGSKSAQTEVQLVLNVTSPRNKTSLKFRRNKICLKGTGMKAPQETVRLDPDSLTQTTNSLYLAIGSAVTMLTLAIITTSTICIRTKNKMRSQEPYYISAIYDSNQHVFVRLGSTIGRTPSAGSGSYATIASLHKSPQSSSPFGGASDDPTKTSSYYASSQVMLLSQSQMVLQDPRSYDSADRLRALSIPRATIVLQELSLEGTFGLIYEGKICNQKKVIIKTVSDAASKLQVSLFLSEGLMMFGMRHKNILPVIATNIDDCERPLLLYAFINRGNLKRFLMKCRQREENFHPPSTQNLVDMAIQVALGLMYLHSQYVCHKDIGTRNCMVDEKLQVKITDSALSRDLFPDDYCCLGDNENRPIKWMALEVLQKKEFLDVSDLWSYGVLIWELLTLAQQPFDNVDAFEMESYLISGYRLEQPVGCPDELFAVMNCCWLLNPSDRPNLVQLLAYLQDFYATLGKFI